MDADFDWDENEDEDVLRRDEPRIWWDKQGLINTKTVYEFSPLEKDHLTTANVLYNAHRSFQVGQERNFDLPYIAIRFGKDRFRNWGDYGLGYYSYARTRRVVDHFVKQELMLETPGSMDRSGGRSTATRLQLRSPLIQWFQKADPNLLSHSTQALSSFVRVKDEKGTLLPLSSVDQPELKRLNENLVLLNEVFSKKEISVRVGGAQEEQGATSFLTRSILRKTLYRIFNRGSLECGGRLYGSEIQSMPQEEGAKLLIDGEPILELDYSAQHPRMLYAEIGETCEFYPYDIPGLQKPDAKKVFMCLLNSKKGGWWQAIKRAQDLPFDTNQDRRKNKRRKILDQRDPTELKALCDKRHPKLAQFWGKDLGVRLQRKDSEIAEQICVHFAEMNEACIPVHDSFIVRQELHGPLRWKMIEAYTEVVGLPPVVTSPEKA